ncbi:NAD(P)-dependent oxidoreductase [Amycolatopsis magusensis]|uniref:NAD(P)-dependent oxidoreductase n=1 Tax=Amycolatopsis magusensis TaxID=882444 RepID=UPI0037940BEA
MRQQAVTVLGLGPMGQAMANVFLAHGCEVTVWNRTPERADDLVAKGAIRAPTVGEAVRAGDLIVLSLTDYAAAYAILEQAKDELAGRTFVNLSSATPAEARQAANWLAALGAAHLTGGVLTPPSGIGTPGPVTLYSGPREVLDAHRATLKLLTGIDYLGEDPGLAALYYQLEISMFWTALLGYVHATAMARANGISATEFAETAAKTFSGMAEFFEFYAPRIDAGDHSGDVDRLSMSAASIEHVVRTAGDSGVDATLPTAMLEIVRRGIAEGHAGDSFTSLIETFRRPVRSR